MKALETNNEDDYTNSSWANSKVGDVGASLTLK
jgi:hypothetical protein